MKLQLTNSAQELQLVAEQATRAYQEQMLGQLRGTVSALSSLAVPQIITVPVLITTTPAPVQMTPTKEADATFLLAIPY